MGENKIIKFPKQTEENEEYINNNSDEYSDGEDWEGDYYYYNKEDWKGLVKLREQVAKSSPEDLNTQWRLGEAYVLNGEYEKAIEFLTRILNKYPDYIDAQHSLLDALFALGRDENSFEWVEKPIVISLSDEIADRCFEFLKPKRKPVSVSMLYSDLLVISGDYIKFNEEELLKYLMNDNRFIIQGDTRYYFDSYVSINRNKKKESKKQV